MNLQWIAMALAFSAPDDASANLLRLVASYSGGAELSITVDGSDVEFVADGAKAFGAHTACRFLASRGPAAEQLLGSTPEQQGKVGGNARQWRYAEQAVSSVAPAACGLACPAQPHSRPATSRPLASSRPACIQSGPLATHHVARV